MLGNLHALAYTLTLKSRVKLVKIQVEVFWVVVVAVGYHCFGGPCCFSHQGEVRQLGPPKH